MRLLLVLIFVSGCGSISTQEEFENRRNLIAERVNEQWYYQDFEYYINSPSETKVLVKTNRPVRTLTALSFTFGTGYADTETVRYYYSLKQNSLEQGFLEAYEYCKRDNKENYETVCEIAMLGDFPVNQLERNYATKLLDSNLFEVNVLNENFSNVACASFVFDTENRTLHNILAEGKDKLLKQDRFQWKTCKTSIRIDLDKVIELYRRPERWSEDYQV